MDDTGSFESTIPLRLEDLEPYKKKETTESKQTNLVSNKDFVDLDAELDDLSSRLAKPSNQNPMNQNENVKTQRLRVNKPAVKSKQAAQKVASKQVETPLTQQPIQEKRKPSKEGLSSHKVEPAKDEHAGASVQHQTMPSTREKRSESSIEKRAEQPQTVHKHGLLMFIAILSLIMGSAGVWIAWETTGEVRKLQQKIQTIEMKMQVQIRAEQYIKKQHPVKIVEHSIAAEIKKKSQIEEKPKPVALHSAHQELKKITVTQVISPATPNVVSAAKPLKKGIWVVNVSSDKSFAVADKKRQKLFESGVDSVVTQKNIKGSLWYRLQIIGFTSKKEAKVYLKKMQNNKHIEGAWVGKNEPA